MSTRTLASFALLSVFALSTAQSFTMDRRIHSAVKDDSNMSFTGSNYQLDLFKAATDPDFYVNNVALTTGAGWDPDLDINSTFEFRGIFGNGGAFGTLLTGEFFDVFNLAFRSGTVASTVAEGVYDFTLEVQGGATDSSFDTLASFDLQLEVVNSINVVASGAVSDPEIFRGESSTASMTVTNNGTRDFVSKTWYYSGDSFYNGTESLTGVFVGNWFDQYVSGGNSRTDNHTIWTASPTQAYDTYVGNYGVIGGLHLGDDHGFRAGSPTITVAVPEPGTLIVLGLGAVAALRRRRSK